MPTELLHPFAVGSDGRLATTGDPDKQIDQRVRTLIGTDPGERVVVSKYGVATQSILFDPDDDLVAESLSLQIEAAMARYEPGVVVRSVNPVWSPSGDGLSEVALDYVRREGADTSPGLAKGVNTAVIHVGGQVSEAIRG